MATKKEEFKIKVPVGYTAIDTQGRRVGAGKKATINADENKRLKKYNKSKEPKETKEVNNGN